MSRRPPPQIEGMHSLKVDNISYNTTQADLRRLFDKYGEIGDIHIPRDKYTRTSKGFAFVRFYSRRDAEYACDKTDGRWMDGRELRVAIARYERIIDDRGGRHRSRSPRRRSRSRSPRYSRSRSPRNRSRSNSPRGRKRSPSRSPPPKGESRSPTATPKSRSPSRSRSPARKRSASPARENRSRSRSASR